MKNKFGFYLRDDENDKILCRGGEPKHYKDHFRAAQAANARNRMSGENLKPYPFILDLSTGKVTFSFSTNEQS